MYIVTLHTHLDCDMSHKNQLLPATAATSVLSQGDQSADVTDALLQSNERNGCPDTIS